MRKWEDGGREGRRTGAQAHRQPASWGHHSGVPFLPLETLQDSLLLSCCCLKPARYFVGPSPAPTRAPLLGFPWAPWSWICPHLLLFTRWRS